jgi:hypothetical protein
MLKDVHEGKKEKERKIQEKRKKGNLRAKERKKEKRKI